MDSIFKNGNGKDKKEQEDKFKPRELQIPKEEEVTVVPKDEEQRELEEEQKRRLAELMPDEFFKMPRPSSRRPACMNCMLVFMMGLCMIVLIAVLWGVKFLGKDLMSSAPFPFPPILLTDDEKNDLDEKIRKYEEALKKAEDGEQQEFSIDLNSNQLNYLLEQNESKTSSDRKIYLRLEPDGSQAVLKISFPIAKAGFQNVTLIGNPQIKNYKFGMEVYSIQIGNVKNSEGMKQKVIDKINRELDTYPRSQKLPFRVKEMSLETSTFHFKLTLKPSK